ncbi:MAG TPA: hypothetical protein VMU95_02370 [Trebonia sp.]|nr:hypothetical protein [Trebonia sp.]
MSKRRMWAALPGVALMAMALAAAGCGTVSSGHQGSPEAGSGSASSATGSVPAASAPAGGSAPGSTGSPSPVPTVSSGPLPVDGKPACADWPAGARKGQLTASFIPVEVLRCVSTTTAVPGQGLYYSATLEKATSDLSVLVAALRQPSRHEPAGTMCPMIAVIPPEIVLIAEDGSTLSPTFPVDGCGLLQSPVTSALNHMPWQVISVRLLARVPGSAIKSSPAPGEMNGSPAVATNR